MILTGENWRSQRKYCSSATSSTAKPTWTGRKLYSGLRGKRLATNRLRYSTVASYSYSSQPIFKNSRNSWHGTNLCVWFFFQAVRFVSTFKLTQNVTWSSVCSEWVKYCLISKWQWHYTLWKFRLVRVCQPGSGDHRMKKCLTYFSLVCKQNKDKL